MSLARRTQVTQFTELQWFSVHGLLGAMVALAGGFVVAKLVVVHSAVGLAIAVTPMLVLLLIQSPTGRICFVAIGGMLVLNSSSGLAVPKVVYASGVALSFLITVAHLARDDGTERPFGLRNLMIASGVFGTFVLGEVLLARARGTPLVLAVRDAAPFLLFASLPWFILDARRGMTRSAAAWLFASIGALGIASYFVQWVGRRGLGALPLTHLTLAGSLPAAVFAVASAGVIMGRRPRPVWLILSIAVMLVMLLTGNRSSLAVLLCPVVVSLLPRRARVRSIFKLFTMFLFVALTVWFALLPLAEGAGLNVSELTSRFGSLSHVGDLNYDSSLKIRLKESDAALVAFGTNLFLGTGPGYLYYPVNPYTHQASDGSFTLDTPIVLGARFGLVGVTIFLVLLCAYWRFAVLLRRDGLTVWRAALIAYLTYSLVWSMLVAPILSDEGSIIAILTLSILALTSPGNPDDVPLEQDHLFRPVPSALGEISDRLKLAADLPATRE